MKSLKEIYAGKTVLVTGHTGFKGSWLCLWLKALGANVVGYSLDPCSRQDHFVQIGMQEQMRDYRGDIRDLNSLQKVFQDEKPEIVFHLAAQALVRQSYLEPVDTYATNVMGTINVLECVRHCESVKATVCITTDKCYENKEQLSGYKEGDAMGGDDPYSASKGACELAITSWRKSYGKAIASARAGNVIGGGDWAKDRIIPDCIRAIQKGEPICIRNPKAIRPWQHVLEPLRGYLMLGAKLIEEPIAYSEGWNFGPHIESICSVWDVASLLTKYYGMGSLVEQKEEDAPHEATLLNLDISKAVLKLGWHPIWSIEQALDYTANWYKKASIQNPYRLSLQQIYDFECAWEGGSAKWKQSLIKAEKL